MTASALAVVLVWVSSVFAQTPPRDHEQELMPALIRVGLPAGTRHHLLFDCAPVRPSTMFRGQSYVADSLSPSHFILRRLASGTPAFGSPDTLDVWLYAEAADQEIALERGDLDVAVFWPGERSARIRNDERWADAPRGVRAHGALVTIAAERDSGKRVPARDLRLLDRTLFSDDLVAWGPPALQPDSSEAGARYVVDPSMPGAKLLERVLSRLALPSARRIVRVSYVATAVRDTLAASWPPPRVQPQFAIGCPVLFSGALARTTLDAPSADDWVSLLTCPGDPR